MTGAETQRPVALVTGALRGIGRACSVALAEAGFNILLNDRPENESNDLAAALRTELATHGADSHTAMGDISDLALHGCLMDAALTRWGRLDCLVNNAGVSARKRGDLLDVEPDSFDACFQVNTRAVFFLCQTVARHMLSQSSATGMHRSLINITSSNARAVSISRGDYCVSKAAASMTTKLFAVRLAAAGIGVYEVRPGIIETRMTQPARALYDQFIVAGHVPAQRWGTPQDVASTVVCMAQGQLAYTVGQAVTVDGGLILPRF